MAEMNKKVVFLAMAILLLSIVVVQTTIDPNIKQIREDAGNQSGQDPRVMMVQLPSQFLIASMTGFREVIASALWVRASTFFEQGKYAPIVPIVRLVTWLDPHNVDFYLTGAWHMDYNFTDALQLSDKRYIPPAISLLKEGCLNNPNIWDIYFDLGSNHYDRKAENPEQALKYIKLACEHDGVDSNTGKVIPRPAFVDRMLARAYEKTGQFDKAIEAYEMARKRILTLKAQGVLKETADIDGQIDVCNKNEMITCYRLAYREGNMKAYKRALELAKGFGDKRSIPDWVYPDTYADYQKRLATNNPPADAKKPLNTNFDVKWERVAPRILRISGHINLLPWSEYKGLASEALTRAYQTNAAKSADKREIWRDGMKLRWMLTDLDYKPASDEAFQWDINLLSTVAWDTASVGGGSFSRKIDFSKNPDIYPLLSDKYKLTVWAAPAEPNCPDFIGDRIGFRGEALADKLLSTTRSPGVKTIVKEFILTREDINPAKPKKEDVAPGKPTG